MIRPEFRKELENQQTILLIVWTGFVVAILFYLWIPHFLLEQSRSLGDNYVAPTVRELLWLIVIAEVSFLLWWKRTFLTKGGIAQLSVKLKLPNMIKGHQAGEEEAAAKVISNYLIARIGSFAIAESIAIYGVALAFMGHYFLDQYMLSLLSAFLLIYLFPSRSFFSRLLTE